MKDKKIDMYCATLYFIKEEVDGKPQIACEGGPIRFSCDIQSPFHIVDEKTITRYFKAKYPNLCSELPLIYCPCESEEEASSVAESLAGFLIGKIQQRFGLETLNASAVPLAELKRVIDEELNNIGEEEI